MLTSAVRAATRFLAQQHPDPFRDSMRETSRDKQSIAFLRSVAANLCADLMKCLQARRVAWTVRRDQAGLEAMYCSKSGRDRRAIGTASPAAQIPLRRFVGFEWMVTSGQRMPRASAGLQRHCTAADRLPRASVRQRIEAISYPPCQQNRVAAADMRARMKRDARYSRLKALVVAG